MDYGGSRDDAPEPRSRMSTDGSLETSPKMVPSDYVRPSPHLTETPTSKASSAQSPAHHPRRSSWADQAEASDEDDYISPPMFHGEYQHFQTPHMGGPPPHAPPPPARRAPPQAPPPARPDTVPRSPGMAPSRFASSPCPPGPPPPKPHANKAPGGPDSKGFAGAGQRADPQRGGHDRDRQRSFSPDPSDGEAPRGRGPPARSAWGNPNQAPPRRGGWGAAPGEGRSDPSSGSTAPAPSQANWEPPRTLGGANDEHPESMRNAWGPSVGYSAAFTQRFPTNRPMSEDFANSGWKDKKLWAPPDDEKAVGKGARAKQPGAPPASAPPPQNGGKGSASGNFNATRAGSKDNAARTTAKEAPGLEDMLPPPARGGKGDAANNDINHFEKERRPKKEKQPKSSLEALDPDSSSEESDDDDEEQPEYAVLDLTVPRTALVINVSHVLKRLSGCCSLNQLNKALKCFKEKTGVTLECFLRANPMTFRLEGRIVYLVDKDGSKWQAPKAEEKGQGQPKGKGSESKKGKGSESKKGKAKGKADQSSGKKGGGKGGKAQQEYYDEYEYEAPENGHWDGAESGKKPRRRGGKKTAAAGYDEWSSHGWDSWETGAWKGDGWSW